KVYCVVLGIDTAFLTKVFSPCSSTITVTFLAGEFGNHCSMLVHENFGNLKVQH
ncbi:unnamed protein product, partial [Urochloa humidicola]